VRCFYAIISSRNGWGLWAAEKELEPRRRLTRSRGVPDAD